MSQDQFTEAIMLFTEGKLDEAETRLYHLLENGPSLEICTALGNLYMKKREHEKAKRFYSWALTFKRNANILNELGLIELRFGNVDAAIDYFRNGLRFESNLRHLLYYNIAVTYHYKGFPNLALVNLELALANKPSFEHAAELYQIIKGDKK